MCERILSADRKYQDFQLQMFSTFPENIWCDTFEFQTCYILIKLIQIMLKSYIF